jgi:hypothetical protein
MSQRDKRQTGLRVEPLEGRALLSTMAGAVAMPASLVRGTSYLFLKGQAHGTTVQPKPIADIGPVTNLQGTAALKGLGNMSVSGTIFGIGNIPRGHVGATLMLSNSKGTVIVELTGPTQRDFTAAPSGKYTFVIEGGTGTYAHVVGHGNVDLTYNATSFSVAFHGGVNNA